MSIEVSEGGSAIVDFSSVEDVTFDLIPRGKYPATIVAVEPTVSKNQNPMWSLQLEIAAGDYEGRRLFTHIVFSEAALPFAKQTLARIAPQILEGPIEVDDPEIWGQLEGLIVEARVDFQTYENEKRNTVKGLYAHNG